MIGAGVALPALIVTTGPSGSMLSLFAAACVSVTAFLRLAYFETRGMLPGGYFLGLLVTDSIPIVLFALIVQQYLNLSYDLIPLVGVICAAAFVSGCKVKKLISRVFPIYVVLAIFFHS